MPVGRMYEGAEERSNEQVQSCPAFGRRNRNDHIGRGGGSYATGRPPLGDDGRYRGDRSRVAFERSVTDDEMDLDSGFLILPAALPENPVMFEGTTDSDDTSDDDSGASRDGGENKARDDTRNDTPAADGSYAREVALPFTAKQSDPYGTWNALATLADVAGEVSIDVRAKPQEGYEKAKLENRVIEPLRQLALITDENE